MEKQNQAESGFKPKVDTGLTLKNCRSKQKNRAPITIPESLLMLYFLFLTCVFCPKTGSHFKDKRSRFCLQKF